MNTNAIAMLIGEGPNGLCIPLLAFATVGEAESYMDAFPHAERLDRPSGTAPRYLLSDDFSEGRLHGEGDDDPYRALFKDGYYYSGCGGCYYVHVEEVQLGVPIVGWDLD